MKNQNYEIFYFQTSTHNPIEAFINKLPANVQVKIKTTIDLIKVFGKLTGYPHIKTLKSYNPLFEIRILGSNSIRIIAFQEKQEIALLHIFMKKSNQTPKKELKTAWQRYQKICS